MNGYQLISTPMEHQINAVTKAKTKPEAFGYLAETGTGKTPMILKEFVERLNTNDVTDLLVIAPAGCIKNWYIDKAVDEPCELKKHLDPKLLENLFVVSNRKNAYWRKLQHQMPRVKKPRALFVNIEALSRGDAKNPSDSEILCRQLLSTGKVMMVIDESTTLRHHKSARSKTILRLGKLARCRRIMTGLVTPRSPLDLFCQFNFLDPNILGISSYIVFRARYAKVRYLCREPSAIVDMRLRQILGRRGMRLDYSEMAYEEKVEKIMELGGWIQSIPLIDEYQNIDELQRKIAPYCFQILKKDCLDLEPKTYQFRDVELTSEQRKLYHDILENATAELSNGAFTTSKSVLDQMIRLHQITCGHVKDENGKIHDVKTNRMNVLFDVLHEHEGKAIVWVVYDYQLNAIINAVSEEFGPEAVARFSGRNLKTRDQEEVRFLTDPRCRFMIATPQTGGRGNTWNNATLSVYASNTYDLEFRYQSEDRNHRYGQTNKVTYIDLITRGTVEEKIIYALRKKIDLATAITGETWREWLV